MMRRSARVLFGTLCLLVTMVAVADEPALQQIARQMARPDLLRGGFVQEKRMTGFDHALRSSGRFVVARGKGVIWTTLLPFPSEVIISADRIYSREADGSRRIQLDASGQPGLHSINAVMFALISGDLQTLARQFQITTSRHGVQWQLQLLPKSAMLARAIVRLKLQGDQYVREVEILEADQDHTLIRFSGIEKTPSPLTGEEAGDFE